MTRFAPKSEARRGGCRGFLLLGVLLFLSSVTVLANTPGLLESVPSGGCYCHCAEARSKGGCVKMCDSKRASGWRLNTCVKPHMQTHTDNSHAGPRFPHPDRAEHAQLTTQQDSAN